jgi:predicted PurR-regulated permease PerM
MTSKNFILSVLKIIGILVGLFLLLLLFYKLSTIIVYVLLAIVFSLIANPVVLFLKTKLKFKNTLAVIATLLLFLLLIVGFVLLFVPLIIKQGENLSLLDINSLEENYNRLLLQINVFLSQHNIDILKLVESSNISSTFSINYVSTFLNSIVSAVGNFGMALASVFFISFFLLKDRAHFFNGFTAVLPTNQKSKILTSIEKIKDLLTRYFIGLFLQLFIIFILNAIVFLIFGVENVFIIALLCAILNVIPYVGPLFAMLVASILIMISGINADFIHETLPTTFYVLIGMFLVQLIDNNINQPIIFSKSTKSHPLEIFLVILSSGVLFGIVGMIIAVPVYTVLKVIGKEFLPDNKLIKALTKDI